jgi:hypothetical protein
MFETFSVGDSLVKTLRSLHTHYEAHEGTGVKPRGGEGTTTALANYRNITWLVLCVSGVRVGLD